MPELPEVETVRRGLQPVMEGFRIVKMEVRRKDLRFPFQRDFVGRLAGQTVTGLGRRAKYLMADLASGDVLASLTWPHGNQIFAIDWCPAGITTGFPFRSGAPAARLKRARELFYDYRLKRSVKWLA